MGNELAFIHRFVKGTRDGATPLLLLHGTGGDEDDLLPLGRMVAPEAPLLSPRGKVLEAGMPRFFRRLAEGVFDEEDVRRRAHELADFVAEARRTYGIAAPIVLGYSNGANITAATMLERPDALAGAILLRAMMPLSEIARADLAGKPVLIVSGASDPILPVEKAARLALTLRQHGAVVEHHTLPAGHQLTQADVDLARTWLASNAPAQHRAGSQGAQRKVDQA